MDLLPLKSGVEKEVLIFYLQMLFYRVLWVTAGIVESGGVGAAADECPVIVLPCGGSVVTPWVSSSVEMYRVR